MFIIENLCPGAASLVDCKAVCTVHSSQDLICFVYHVLLQILLKFFDSWGDIANCLYPAFIGASDTCERLGICKVNNLPHLSIKTPTSAWTIIISNKAKSVFGDLTCPDCMDIIERIGDFLTQTDTMSQGEEILKVTMPCSCS